MQLFFCLALWTGLGTSRIQETFDLSKFQVSESPKIWVFDNILSESLLSNVDYDFEHYNETNMEIGNLESMAPHFADHGVSPDGRRRAISKKGHGTHAGHNGRRRGKFRRLPPIPRSENGYPAARPSFPPQHWDDDEEGEDEKWVYMRPEDATSLVETIKKLGHVRHSYHDMIAIMEKEKGAEDQDAHMDRYEFRNHPDYLAKTVNLSLLQDVGDGINFIPRVSFVINFSDEGGCRFPNGTNVKFIPAKRGRVVMFENYLKGGSKIDPLATHFGVYGKTGGKRVLTAGILYNGDGPDFRSPRMSSEGFLYFPSGGVYAEASEGGSSEGYKRAVHDHGGGGRRL